MATNHCHPQQTCIVISTSRRFPRVHCLPGCLTSHKDYRRGHPLIQAATSQALLSHRAVKQLEKTAWRLLATEVLAAVGEASAHADCGGHVVALWLSTLDWVRPPFPPCAKMLSSLVSKASSSSSSLISLCNRRLCLSLLRTLQLQKGCKCKGGGGETRVTAVHA